MVIDLTNIIEPQYNSGLKKLALFLQCGSSDISQPGSVRWLSFVQEPDAFHFFGLPCLGIILSCVA